jgi:hypothetical protein
MHSLLRSLLQVCGLEIQGDVGPFTTYTSHRGRLVIFMKAPPKEPPSRAQVSQRNLFRIAGWSWTSMPPTEREDWQRAARAARLRISGYNLWVHWVCSHDLPTLRTVERTANVNLHLTPEVSS